MSIIFPSMNGKVKPPRDRVEDPPNQNIDTSIYIYIYLYLTWYWNCEYTSETSVAQSSIVRLVAPKSGRHHFKNSWSSSSPCTPILRSSRRTAFFRCDEDCDHMNYSVCVSCEKFAQHRNNPVTATKLLI